MDGKFSSTTNRWTIPIQHLDEIKSYLCSLDYSWNDSGEFPKQKPRQKKAQMRKVTCKNLVEVLMDYDAEIVEFFKTIQNRQFDCLSTVWSFPLNQYHAITDRLMDMGVIISQVSEFTIKNTARVVA